MGWMLLIAGAAWAHKPSFSAGEYGSADDAFFVAEPEISIVVYHEVTCDASELWLTFPIDTETPLYVQLGVPVIDRLRDQRPAIAILAPGLPSLEGEDLPFDVPDDLGGLVYWTDDMGEEEYTFYEPFTQTESWIYVEEYVDLPESGLGYVVAWNPDEMTGKLWVATGTVEDFSDVSPSDFSAWLPAVQTYHETAEDMPDPPEAESSCAQPEEEQKEVEAATGCNAVVGGSAAAWLSVLLLGLRRRNH